MIHFTHSLAGDECHIYMPERRSELTGFYDFLSRAGKVLCVDTETSGLDIYAPGFELRLFQIGDAREAWVLRADIFRDVIAKALRMPLAFTMHNAPYDLKVLDRHVGVPFEELVSRTFDTRVFAHLIDPRQQSEGGAGLRLKELAAIYVDDSAPDTQDGLNAVFRSIKNPQTGKPCTKNDGWAHIPIDHPTYVRYAGLDVLLGARLFAELAPIIKDLGLNDLSKFEHHLQGLLMVMERRGVLIDVPYVHTLDQRLADEAEHFAQTAARYGVENVNSTAQVADALLGMGEALTEKTPSGAWKVDKAVLMSLADLDDQWSPIESRTPNPLADAVLRAKRAGKWRTSYVESFLKLKDSDDRIHPTIGGLSARTARMSISKPPLQQLPSGDWTIRRAMIADPGKLIIAADYSQVEMRVLAALCQDETLMEAIKSGTDLHDFTAAKVFGPDFTKRQRKVAKAIGFGKVYGGGATTVSRQTGVPIADVKPAMAAYDATFPGIKRYGARLQSRAQYGKREVITVSGRHLPLDRDRLYAATNYVVQSTARDLLAQAIVDIFDAGLGDTLLLPVHDELIAQADAADAEEVIHEIGRLMESSFYSIPIVSDPEVYGRSWGSGYHVPAELDAA
ncbi:MULTISPECIES: DNA polymerase [Bacteria]|uniref:DNA polymerase n=1 Tax=Bacteria TaxID=2 RepID=UPI003C7E0DDE